MARGWRRSEARSGAEAEFLPGVLAVQARPPSPTARATLWALLALVAVALGWACWARIDVVAVARGRVVTDARDQLVQARFDGTVQAIRVRDGDRVAAGEVLIALDPRPAQAAVARARAAQAAAAAEVAVLEAALAGVDGMAVAPAGGGAAVTGSADAVTGAVASGRRAPAGAGAADLARPAGPDRDVVASGAATSGGALCNDVHAPHRGALVPVASGGGGTSPSLAAAGNGVSAEGAAARAAARLAALRARLAVLGRRRAVQRDAVRAARAERDKLAALVPIVTRRAAALERLARQGLGAEDRWLEAESVRLGTVQDLAVARARLAGLEAELERLAAERAAAVAAFRSDTLEALAAARERRDRAQAELAAAEVRLGHARITAPVDGVVQGLAVHTIGGVVAPGQVLARVVPDDAPREVEVAVLNRDVGFVRAGQPVRVKVDTFPFTRYGVLSGRLADLSPDARADERLGWVYTARVALADDRLTVDGRDVRLAPGMTVTAELRTGSRRVIAFLLSPLVQAAGESLRER